MFQKGKDGSVTTKKVKYMENCIMPRERADKFIKQIIHEFDYIPTVVKMFKQCDTVNDPEIKAS